MIPTSVSQSHDPAGRPDCRRGDCCNPSCGNRLHPLRLPDGRLKIDPWIILTVGASVGILLGAGVAAICLVKRPQWWTILLRLPKGLHRRLRHHAKDHMQSVSDEIVSRLQRSVDEDHPKR